MNSSLRNFKNNLIRVRELGILADSIERLTTMAIDVSDIFRAQLVLSVSALDHFIHEIVLIGMIECAKGTRQKTSHFLKFSFPFESIDKCFSGQTYEQWVGEFVHEKHSWQSFQHPDKIADAIRLISPVQLWQDISKEINLPDKDIKKRLELIVDRRNKIAHEADMDPTNPGFRWAISKSMVDDSIDFIESVVNAIAKVVF